MNSKQKVACQGCHKPILVATANKYQGYSRQCLAKKQNETKIVGPSEPSAEEIRFYLHKTQLKFPKIYYYNEFIRIWALKGSPVEAHKYYLRYLEKVERIVFDLMDIAQKENLIYKPYAEVVTA